MVSRAEMEAYVKETIAGQEYLLESRLQQAKDFVEQLDLKTALVNTKAEQLKTEVDNAHERLAGVVTEMNKIKTVIEGKFDGIQVDIKSEWDRRQAEVDIAFVQIKEAFDEIRAAAGAEFAEIKAAAGVEFAQVAQTGKDSIEALRNHIEFWATLREEDGGQSRFRGFRTRRTPRVKQGHEDGQEGSPGMEAGRQS